MFHLAPIDHEAATTTPREMRRTILCREKPCALPPCFCFLETFLTRSLVIAQSPMAVLPVRSGVRAYIGAEIAVNTFGNMLTPPSWLPHQHSAHRRATARWCDPRESTRVYPAQFDQCRDALARFLLIGQKHFPASCNYCHAHLSHGGVTM